MTNFNWKLEKGVYKLFLSSEDTKYSVVFSHGLMLPQDIPGKFYKIRNPDAVLSQEFYNLARAKDNCIKDYCFSIFCEEYKKNCQIYLS